MPSKINRYAKKARYIPNYTKIKVKELARPTVRRGKKVASRAKKGSLLLVSKRARDIRNAKKPALLATANKDWQTAATEWRHVIDTFGKQSPIEAYFQLSNALQQTGGFDKATDVISSAMKLYPAGRDKSQATQKDLLNLLALSKEKAEISIRKRINNIDAYKKSIRKYQQRSKKDPKDLKIAVFSAISGGYDTVKPPEYLDERFDYILFSDTAVESTGIHEIRPLPYLDFDNTRSARYVKTNPHKLLADYDLAVWIDANLMITGDIYELVDRVIKSGKPFGAIKHPVRKSVYDEMLACLAAGKDDVEPIVEQRDFYKKQGYETNELIESNVLVYDLRENKLDGFLNDWWNQIDRYSKRDQFSINYCLDKNNISWLPLTERPNSTRNHPALALTHHGKSESSLGKLTALLDTGPVDPLVTTETYKAVKAARIKAQSHRTIDAIVCVHNALEDVIKCLQAIKRFKHDKLTLIIVDDGSDKPTADFLINFYEQNKTWVRRVRHEKAKGYTKAANAGLRASTADFVILLNSDTVPTDGWALKMADVAYTNPGVGIVGPLSSAASHQSVPDHKSTTGQTAINELPPGLTSDDMNSYCEQWGSAELIPRVPLVHGFCYGIRREVIDSIGYLDEVSFPRGYGEENDYCFRAADAGFSLALATHTYVFHSKSKSFSSEERIKNMQAGGKAFRDKHGQRRITRAVRSMENNAVLKNLRRLAGRVYTQQVLLSPKSYETIVKTSKKDLVSLPYGDLIEEQARINEELIKWDKLPVVHKKENTKVSVIILILNNLSMTERCVESVVAAKNETNYEVILVNNGSDLETLAGLRKLAEKHPQLKLIHIDQNVNFAVGNNIGFSHASGDIDIFLNNDTIVTDYWIDKLVEPLQKKDVVAVQPSLLYPDKTVQSLGTVFTDKAPFGYALYVGKDSEDPVAKKDRKLQAVTAACAAVRAKDFAKARGFDPAYINGQEDVDLCLRLAEGSQSRYCYTVAKSVVYHDESKTPGRGKYVYQNRQTFADRWGKKIQPDDENIYAEDGFIVDFWRKDLIDGMDSLLTLYSPRLKKGIITKHEE